PDPQLIVIKPWDKSLLPAIEKAIQLAQLNLNPIVDKDLIRVPVPTLTTERRQEMVKILHQRAEEGRVMLRQIRADIRKDIEKQEGEAGISEDDLKANFTELDDLVKEYMEKIEELVKSKEKDLLTI
ncbi:MAG TPA: ribosome-recycling factor, partial [Candidatus Woesebacteria bacterium]|nr:ribosome-recycling factor [Candidatus Woesebacteria bacterium]